MGTIQERGDLWNTEQLTEFPSQPNNSPPPSPAGDFLFAIHFIPCWVKGKEDYHQHAGHYCNFSDLPRKYLPAWNCRLPQFKIPMQEVSTM